MRSYVSRIGILIAVVAAAMGSSSVSARAVPAGGGITVLDARLVTPIDATLEVDADDGNGLILTSMTVHILQNGNDLLDVPMSTTSTTPAAQAWLSGASALATLQPGTYTMTVDASDGVETDNALPAGTLPFVYVNVQVTGSFTPAGALPSLHSVIMPRCPVAAVRRGGRPMANSVKPARLCTARGSSGIRAGDRYGSPGFG